MSITPPNNWSAVKAIFLAAVERPAEEREAYVAEACGGDEALRNDVLSLLAAHADGRESLDVMPFGQAASVIKAALADAAASAFTLGAGTRIGQYEVLEPIGSGGMGHVYRARDTKLDRIVALKFLLDGVPARNDRVLREGRAASALNHPNICTLFEAGEFEGQPYLAMEYVDGRPLDSMIPPGGMHVEDLRRYGTQIADALAHAHEHGVIHRDLKGANVAVTGDGRAKVLDFGVARRVVAPGNGRSTSGTSSEAGRMAGTLAYMAPELLQGGPADARSDIWALGVLLYEMAAGRRPFTGDAFALTAAIMKDMPPPLPATVPGDLRQIIFRCLAREPDSRYQHASEIASALRSNDQPDSFGVLRVAPRRAAIAALAAAIVLAAAGYGILRWRQASGPASATRPAEVVVLPFQVLSGEAAIGFLGIGIPDTIVSRIAQVRSIKVRAMLAPGRVKDDPQEIGRTLGADYVLTGTIQQGGDHVRITPRLIRVADAVAIWTNTFTKPANDLLRLQDEIARQVLEVLPVRTTRADLAGNEQARTTDSEAYALYVKGRDGLARNSASSVKAAVASFEAARDRDPGYVLAYTGLAMACARMRLYFAAESDVPGWERCASEAAQTALRLEPELAQSHEALAAVYRSIEFNWPIVIDESTLALARNPSLDQPHAFRAAAFMHLGLLDRVEADARAGMALNPGNLEEPLRVHGSALLYGGQFTAAVSVLEQASAESKAPVDWNLAYAYYNAGRKADAEVSLLRLAKSTSARSQRRAQATLAGIRAAEGRRDEASELIEAVLAGSYRDHHIAYALGAAYAQLDQPVEALRWLGEARNSGFPCYPWFATDPLLAPLRGSSAFERFMVEFKQAWETKKAQFASVR